MDIQFLNVELCFCLQFPLSTKSLLCYFNVIFSLYDYNNPKDFSNHHTPICLSAKINVFVYQNVHTVNDELWIRDGVFIWRRRAGVLCDFGGTNKA